MENKHLPAYPQPIANDQSSRIYASSQLNDAFGGLSKLEMVSAMCLQGLLANSSYSSTPESRAELAVKHATAILNHLSNTEK